MPGVRGLLAHGGLAVLLSALWISTVQGQNRRTRLTLDQANLAVTTTTPTDYDAGAVAIGSLQFTVDLTSNSGAPLLTRVTTVNISCGAGCPAGVARLQWRRADLGTWNTLSTTPTLVEQRTATFNAANDPWSRQLFWRYTLDWAAVPPSAAVNYPVVFQLVVTAP